MRWKIENVLTTVTDATEEEIGWLSSFLSYTSKRYLPWKKRYEEESVSLLKDRQFPTGLVRMAHRESLADNVKVMLEDTRTVPCVADLTADLEWLKHHPAVDGEITHQIDSVQACLKHKRGIVWVPTGGGKTEVAIGIAKSLPCQWLFLVHRADLLRQTADRYKLRTGKEAGIIGDGEVAVPMGCRFVVATFQTMAAAMRSLRQDVLKILRDAEGLMIDECHTLPASTFSEVTMQAKSAYFRFGFSGTPLARGDGRNLMLIGGLGPVVFRVEPNKLVELGLLAQPKITMVPVLQTSNAKVWREVYRDCVVDSGPRNDALVQIAKNAEKPALLFVHEVRHGKMLCTQLTQSGLKAEFVYGDKDTTERRAAIQRLVRTDTDVLVVSGIFQEGVDIPSLRSVIVATGGASAVAAVQRIGRGLRSDVSTSKQACEIWDVADIGCGCRKGGKFDHTACRWLYRHTQKRIGAYEGEGYVVQSVPITMLKAG